MKISLILPLFDRRTAGWKPLESALNQTVDRNQYEVIAVVGRADFGDMRGDARVEALLERCDAVVPVDADPNRLDHEILFCLAGYEKSTGDVLFFMEGHTIVDRNCCATIAAHFRDNPQSETAWAPRIYFSETSLGILIGMHGKRHEGLARERGAFNLGANCCIRKTLFERMGRLDPVYMRFGERVLFERMVREKVAIGRIESPLATHYDDMPVQQWMSIAVAAGTAKFRYYNAPVSGPGAGRVQVRHKVYLYANHDATAFVLFPLFSVLSMLFLGAAIGLFDFSRKGAYKLYVLALGFADLSGFCKARIRAAWGR